jgi:peptidoglycan/LPS O-acetylase OafA/YrhL
MSPFDDDAALEAWLAAGRDDDVPDDGFSVAVLQRLAQEIDGTAPTLDAGTALAQLQARRRGATRTRRWRAGGAAIGLGLALVAWQAGGTLAVVDPAQLAALLGGLMACACLLAAHAPRDG